MAEMAENPTGREEEEDFMLRFVKASQESINRLFERRDEEADAGADGSADAPATHDDDDIDMRYLRMMRGFFKELSRDLATGTLRFRDDRGTIQPDGSLLPYPPTTEGKVQE